MHKMTMKTMMMVQIPVGSHKGFANSSKFNGRSSLYHRKLGFILGICLREVLHFFVVDDGTNPLSDDSDSDFEESVLRKRQKGKEKPKKEDMPSEPISTASSLLNILTGLLDSEVFKGNLIQYFVYEK